MGQRGDTCRFDTTLDAIEALGILRTPRRRPTTDRDDEGPGLEGEVLVAGRWVTIRLSLDDGFPLTLPRVFLRPWDALGFIPHIDVNGCICYAEPEGMVLDRGQPVDIAREALARALSVLDAGVSGRNRSDFADEFGVYWSRIASGSDFYSIIEPTDVVQRVFIATCKDDALQPLVAASQDAIAAFYNGHRPRTLYTLQNALYLPLQPGTIIVPPRVDRPMWSAEEARQLLLPALSDANKRQLRRLAKGSTAKREYVLARLPRPSGGDTLFCIRYDEVRGGHPLLDGGKAARLVPLQVERLDRRYLVHRGGGDTDVDKARVLVIGCGSLGGHVAFELARAGIRSVTLVDRDILTPDNTHRHVLGRPYWFSNKAAALASAIEREIPFVKVDRISSPIEQALADGIVDLAAYDLVVCALGNPTVELDLNERLRALAGGAALFTWLEPLGLGGHALLITDRTSRGCFQCLYTSLDEGQFVHNRASFAEEGQSFGRALSGCGSTYTPYGSVDVVQTAALAVRLALAALTGKETGNPLESWKGDAAAFTTAGYRVSARYRRSMEQLSNQRYTYAAHNCPICSVDSPCD